MFSLMILHISIGLNFFPIAPSLHIPWYGHIHLFEERLFSQRTM